MPKMLHQSSGVLQMTELEALKSMGHTGKYPCDACGGGLCEYNDQYDWAEEARGHPESDDPK